RFLANNDLSNVRLDSIRFEGTNFYVLEGNGITLSNGIIQNQTASGADFENPITLGASQVFTNGAAFLTFNGDLSLGAHTLTLAGNGDFAFGFGTGDGVISGTGGFVKNGSGDMD